MSLLKNIVKRALIDSGGGAIEPPHLHLMATSQTAAQTPIDNGFVSLAEQEKRYIVHALEATHWVVEGPGGTAQLLDINPGTLRSRMKKLGIERPR